MAILGQIVVSNGQLLPGSSRISYGGMQPSVEPTVNPVADTKPPRYAKLTAANGAGIDRRSPTRDLPPSIAEVALLDICDVTAAVSMSTSQVYAMP